MIVWRSTFAPIRNRFMPAGLEGGCDMQLRTWSNFPASVLEYLVGYEQQEKSHAGIEDKHSGIDDPARKGVHMVQLNDVSGHCPENRRRSVDDIINESHKKKANRQHQGNHCRNDL